MTDLSEAHKLCSKSELKLVEGSFAPMLEKVTPADLKVKIDGVTTLHQKCADMIAFLHSDSRIRTTQRKLELFREALQRYDAALKRVESAKGAEPLVVALHDNSETATNTELPGADGQQKHGERQLEARDNRTSSPAGARAEQRGRRSHPTGIPAHAASIPRRQQGRRNSSKNH